MWADSPLRDNSLILMRARGQGRGVVALGTLLAGILVASRPCAFALNPALDVSQYAHTSWKVRDGFPNGSVSSIAHKVAAVGRGSDNAALAKKLGADIYIDSNATDAALELQKMGGDQVILATAPNSKAMSALVDGLAPNGKLIVLGATFDPIEVTPAQLISGSRSLQGWSTGTPADSEDTLRFSELTGVRAMIETYPLEKVAEAYARMMSGKAEFRVVLTM